MKHQLAEQLIDRLLEDTGEVPSDYAVGMVQDYLYKKGIKNFRADMADDGEQVVVNFYRDSDMEAADKFMDDEKIPHSEPGDGTILVTPLPAWVAR